MKKKGVNSILICIVIFVWLFAFKKIFNFFDDEINIDVLANTEEVANISTLEFKKDTFRIQNYNRDPFLDIYRKKNRIISRKTESPKKTTIKSGKKENISILKWPKLQYFGYLKGGDETRKLALIKIDNKLHRVREKQSRNEVFIKKVFKDSVILQLNKEIKTIKK